jgi:hypothetical protein
MSQQSRVIAVVVGGVFLVVLAGLLVGSVRPTPIVEQLQGREPASTPTLLSNLGLGALVGALVGVVGTHLLREQAERAREVREGRSTAHLILRAPPEPGATHGSGRFPPRKKHARGAPEGCRVARAQRTAHLPGSLGGHESAAIPASTEREVCGYRGLLLGPHAAKRVRVK